MKTPTNTNQIIPILGKKKGFTDNEYIGSSFIIKIFNRTILCSAGHTFNSDVYSNFYYSIDGTLNEIVLDDLVFDFTNQEFIPENGERIGEKRDYAFLEIETNVVGLSLDFDELNYGEAIEYKGFSPIKNQGLSSEAEYVEFIGTHDSDNPFDYTGQDIGEGRSIKLKMKNIRKAQFENCVQGNSGGVILKNGTDKVVGMLTNGIEESIIYVTSDFLLEKLIEIYKT